MWCDSPPKKASVTDPQGQGTEMYRKKMLAVAVGEEIKT